MGGKNVGAVFGEFGVAVSTVGLVMSVVEIIRSVIFSVVVISTASVVEYGNAVVADDGYVTFVTHCVVDCIGIVVDRYRRRLRWRNCNNSICRIFCFRCQFRSRSRI